MTLAETIAAHGRPYGSGRFAPPGTLPDALTEPLRDYKLKVAKRYRTLPPALVDMVMPEGRLFVSPKIDGELWFALKVSGETVLCAPNGRVLSGLPVAVALERCLDAAGDDALVAGELFVAPARQDSGRPRVFHVARALRDPSQAIRIGFKAFDVARWRGQDMLRAPYEERLALLAAAFPESGPASRITTVLEDKRGVTTRYREWVESKRYEGLVARHDTGGVYKVKPEIGLDAVVIAWSDRLVLDRVELRELHVALLREDGSFHVLGTVGGGIDAETRLRLQERVAALACPSSYRMANREGTLCRFVRPELVIEIKCNDLMASDPGEPPTLRMTLAYDPDSGWSAREALPLPVMIGPVFVRERDDKRVDLADVGLEQIRQITPFEDEEREPQPGVREARVSYAPAPEPSRRSTVITRKVWTKESKGQTNVRKLVAWATNKSEVDPRFPPYVVAFTDFAAGRKEPLQRDLRVASSPDRLDEQIRRWEADNIKKGWVEVAQPAPETVPEESPSPG